MAYNGGRYSKFQQRLRNIVLNRFKKKTKKVVNQEEFIKDKVNEIKREVSNNRAFITNKGVNISEKRVIRRYGVDDVSDSAKEQVNVINRKANSDKVVKSNIDVDKNNTTLIGHVKRVKSSGIFVNKKKKLKDKILDTYGNSNKEELNRYSLEIIEKLKNKFIEKSAELEVLESELFLLSQVTDDTLELEKVKEVKTRINEMINEINLIIEQYNLYNRRYSLDTFVGFDDKYLEDDIIHYRSMLENYGDQKKFVNEYKLLDEFKGLYLRLDNIKRDVLELQDSNEEKIEKYDIRDKNYDEVVLKTIKIDNIRKDFSYELNKQNEYLNELMKKIGKINREEYVTRHLAGLGNFLFSGLRFLGLRMLSPLSGLIPSIATETQMARNLIRVARENLQVEEVRHVYYSAVNFDSELNSKITDINYTEYLIDDTLKDIKRLKEDFLKIYDVNVPGYDKTMDSINKMEEVMYKNQYKVSYIKKRLKQSKKINENKMIKVKKMNENRS